LKPLFENTFLILLFAVCPYTLFSQIRCGTVEYTEKLKTEKTLFEDKEIFEKWIREKQRQKARMDGARRTTSTFQVPVVVHVIHNGEAVGIGKNIQDAQILSQISVLNKDFNRLNTDAGETPAEFLPSPVPLISNLYWQNKTLKGCQPTA
jgi:hypothetical protein